MKSRGWKLAQRRPVLVGSISLVISGVVVAILLRSMGMTPAAVAERFNEIPPMMKQLLFVSWVGVVYGASTLIVGLARLVTGRPAPPESS